MVAADQKIVAIQSVKRDRAIGKGRSIQRVGAGATGQDGVGDAGEPIHLVAGGELRGVGVIQQPAIQAHQILAGDSWRLVLQRQGVGAQNHTGKAHRVKQSATLQHPVQFTHQNGLSLVQSNRQVGKRAFGRGSELAPEILRDRLRLRDDVALQARH